jgi:hypothetical protein
MENKDEIRKELEELSPFLSKMKKEKEGFEVPTNYFKQLPDLIMDRIQEEEAPSYSTAPTTNWLDQIIERIQLLLQPQYAMALASVAILIVASIFFFGQNDDLANATTLAEVSDDEISSYVMNNVEEFEMDLLMEVMDEEVLEEELENESSGDDNYLDDIIDDLSDEELEELM